MEDKIKQFLKTIKMNESMLSMLFGVVTVVLVGVLVFRMYESNKPEITEEAMQEEAQPTEMVGEVEVTVDEETGEKRPAKLAETYTVQEGDHLWKIAESQYGSGYNWVDIAKENELSNPGVLLVGQELKLPKVAVIELESDEAATMAEKVEVENKIEGDTYTVAEGDNLWDICVRAYADGYKWSEVADYNELANANVIEVGQELKLPR